ncbi:MAG: c-type cytochrome [Gemmatimonadales bacterium]
MTVASKCVGAVALVLLLGLGQAGCNRRTPGVDDAAPAPVDRGAQTGRVGTGAPDTSAATPPITPPSPAGRDTPPAGAEAGKPSDAGAKSGGSKVSRLEYEGWRQYSANCARCHGQDALPNPVAANLLLSVGPKGPFRNYDLFAEVVTGGRPASGMPAFKGILTPEQIKAIHAYVNGRAEGRIPPGRPEKPGA